MRIMILPQRNRFKALGCVRWKSGEDGQALIEFAVSACVLLPLVVGILSICQAVYAYSYVTDAAQEAARYGIVRGLSLGVDCTAPGYATCIAQSSDVQSYVTGLALPGLDPTKITVTTNWLNSDGSSCGTADNCKAPGNSINVAVNYDFVLVIPLLPTRTVNLSSTSQMVVVQ